MNRYRRDPFLDECSRELDAARAALRRAEAERYGVVEARNRFAAAHGRLDRELQAAAQLSEEERQFAIERGMPATKLVDARAKLSRTVYLEHVAAGKPLPSRPSLAPRTSHASRLPNVVCGIDVGLVTPLFAGQ